MKKNGGDHVGRENQIIRKICRWTLFNRDFAGESSSFLPIFAPLTTMKLILSQKLRFVLAQSAQSNRFIGQGQLAFALDRRPSIFNPFQFV